MKFFAFLLSIITFGINVLNAAAVERPFTPPTTAYPRVFGTPERTLMKAAITPSPARRGRKAVAEAVIITAANLKDSAVVGAPLELISELLLGQQRPFAIICPFSRGRLLLQPPSLSDAREAVDDITHVILTPTHPSDYYQLVAMNESYQASIEIGGEPFLSRNYGSPATFAAKLEHLYKMYANLPAQAVLKPLQAVLKPLFYKEPTTTPEFDPDFISSITFSILGIVDKDGVGSRLEVLGDIWLSHFEEIDVVCLKGTAERSTMVGLPYQSMGVGQTAVGAFNKYLVNNWLREEAYLIVPESHSPQKSGHHFDGIMAYVEPANFKSIGNNFRSNNFLVGAINMGGETADKNKPMLMFRAPSMICTPQHLAVDALTQMEAKSPHASARDGSAESSESEDSTSSSPSNAKTNLFSLWELVKSLYPSRNAVKMGDWIISDALQGTYATGPTYAKNLATVTQIIREFDGFLPQYSERAIARSSHFASLDPRLLFIEADGKHDHEGSGSKDS